MEEVKGNTTRPRETVRVIFDHQIPNIPGKSLVGLQVSYPPSGFTPPHRHAGATVVAIVQTGHVLSGMNGEPPTVYGTGENFFERPGCHHTVGENASETEGAGLLAVFVVDTDVLRTGGYEGLTVLDGESV